MGNKVPSFRRDRLKALREKDGKTQEEVAELLGYTPKQYRAWETNGKFPSTQALLSLCSLFGVDCDYLLGRIDEKTHDLEFVCQYIGLSEKSVELLHSAASDPFGRAHNQTIDRLLSSEQFHSRVVYRLMDAHDAACKLRNGISNEKKRRQFIDQFNHSQPNIDLLKAIEFARTFEGAPDHNSDKELLSYYYEGVIGVPHSELSTHLVQNLRISVFDLSNALLTLIDELLNTDKEIDEAKKLLLESAQHIIDVDRLERMSKEAQVHGNDDEAADK